MSKRIALKDYILIDGVDLSNFCRGVTYASTDDRIDASGFNSTGASEFLAGIRTDEVTLDIIMGRGASEPHQILQPLHRDRSTFDFVWRADSSAGVSSTNPELRGSAILPVYGEGATRGDLEVTSVTLVAGSSTGFVFYET